jgi:uncharacterized protein
VLSIISKNKTKIMKKVMFLLAGLIMAVIAHAQNNNDSKHVPTITVEGSSEMEITPDIIYLDISLREYKGQNITTLENQLYQAVIKAGIPKEDLTVSNVFGDNYDAWWAKKKKTPDFMARKQYRLKLSKLDKVNEILDGVDDKGIESVNIGSFTSSKMEEYRQEVKIKAIQAAKAKAEYMLKAIGNKLGDTYDVDEINNYNDGDVQPNILSNTLTFKARAVDEQSADISFKTIRIRAQVRATFTIL